MKQHITVKQAQELNSSKLKTLEDNGILEKHKIFYGWARIAEQLTIGKMIEILSLYESQWQMYFCEGEYNIQLDRFMGAEEAEGKELCDLLWMAVLKVLEV